jgi:EAL domain-containing protein (putative c-di-GMP-specific phosphodiesterase class I)
LRASLGIALGDLDARGAEAAADLLRNADLAMYMAKEQGKGRYQMFEPAMHETVVRRLELKADLQRAVERGEFVLEYQPIVVLETSEISGVEALVRWKHPERGIMAPGEFIPLAEDTGLIVEIGGWVLGEACTEAIRLQKLRPRDPPISMSVNIAAAQLARPEIVTEVREALRSAGVPPQSLVLEITETAMMQAIDLSILRLHQLKELGVRVAVDDFGTGFSSLNYIRQFPVDILKIDKSFIDNILQGGEERALTGAIVELGDILDLVSVAEGIEQAEQVDVLTELHCQLGQGFHFARPLPRDEIEELVGTQARAAA